MTVTDAIALERWIDPGHCRAISSAESHAETIYMGESTM